MPAQQQQKPKSGAQTLVGFNLGYNGYADPATLGPRQWAASSNVYSGQHGNIRRARFAPVVAVNTANYTAGLARFLSLFNFRDPTPQALVLGDNPGTTGNATQWSFNVNSNYKATQRINPYVDPTGKGNPLMGGSWSRTTMFNTCFECNGAVKQTGRSTNCATIEGWGLDLPDASIQVVLTAGAITKTIGRSYVYAWENFNKLNVGGPSPATSYIVYSAQQGTLQLVETGTVTTTQNKNTVIGSGTSFTAAWIGRSIWLAGVGGAGRVVSVESATQLTLDTTQTTAVAGGQYQIYDPQATHIRLYATADGGATFFRIQRNSFVPTATTLSAAGLQFTDNDNSEPPSGEFTSEQAQFYNVPPPIGTFLYQYQSRVIVFGVAAAPQTFWYSNIEATAVGNPPECYAPLNQVTLPIGDAKINAAAGVPTGLILWSDKHDMFKVTGLLTDNTQSTTVQQGASVQQLPYALGAASAYASVVAPVGTVWLTSDKEVYLYSDQYAPKNVGRTVQDILTFINPNNLSDARMVAIHANDRNWIALSIAYGTSTFSNKLLILDLDMLESNGAPSFFVFDMATNQPTWYVFDVSCEAITSIFDDAFGVQHLLVSDIDQITDVTYAGGFNQNGELNVSGYVTLHAIGNDTSQFIKDWEWVRFVTNQDPSAMFQHGWSFRIDAIDDDFYTFLSPYSINLLPQSNSPIEGDPAATRPGTSPAMVNIWPGPTFRRKLEFSQALFKTKGTKAIKGRRHKITVNFPSFAGFDYELRAIEFEATPFASR